MHDLATLVMPFSLSLFAVSASTTTHTTLDCYQFGSYDEAQAAYEVDLASLSPTLTYLDDDGDGLICECLYYEELCYVPDFSDPPAAVDGGTVVAGSGAEGAARTGPSTRAAALDAIRAAREGRR